MADPFTLIPVAQTYYIPGDPDIPAGSTVTFTLSAPMTNTVTGDIEEAVPHVVPISRAGLMSVTLPATTDPATSPVGATYTVVEAIGNAGRSYAVPIRHDTGPLVLGLIAPADVAPPVTYGLSSIVANSPLSAVTAAGVVTLSLDGSGYTTDAELAAEASTRAGADTTLGGLITTEASTARAAEGTNATAISTHTALTTTAHGGLVSSADARLSDARTPLTHTHAEGDTTGLVSDLAGKAATAHTHTHASTTGQGADDHHAKSHTHNADGSGTLVAASLPTHTHAEADTTNLVTDLAAKAPTALFPLAVGYWYAASNPAVSSGAIANGNLLACPFRVGRAGTVDQLACEIVTTPGGTGSVIRLGIYNTVAGVPSGLVVDAGTVPGTSTGIQTITGLSVALTPGLYWLVGAAQGAPAPNPTLRVNTGSVPEVGATTTALLATSNSAYLLGTAGTVTGAFPGTAGAATIVNAGIRVIAHISA